MPRRILFPRVLTACAGACVLLAGLGAATAALAQYNPHPRIYLTPEKVQRIRTQHWQAGSYEWGRLMAAAAREDLDGAKAQALAYAITGDEDYATTAIGILQQEMIDTPVATVTFNSVGRIFNVWALCFDWLYNSPQFTPALKQQVVAYISQIPKDGSGKWNWYPDGTYFNGVSKVLWGPPIWGLATHGDNPIADDYIDNGYTHRWMWIRNSLGYGPANLAVARGGCEPQGMDYASGTLSNIVRWLAATKSASNQDLFDEGPALREFMEFFVKSYYYTEEFIRRPEHGHNAHKESGYIHNAITALLVLMDEYRTSEEAQWASWWLNNIEGADAYPGVDYRYFAEMDVIFSDHGIPQVAPTAEPLAYFAEGNGMWIARSNWTQGATEPTTYATFRAGNWTWFNQNHWDQGNFCIYSHGEDLLIDGGLYEGAGGYTVINYHHQTIAHNSLLIKDPQQTRGWHFYDWTLDTYENSGGQNRPWRETLPESVLDGTPKDSGWQQYQGTYLHDMSDVLRRAHNDRYTYAFANLTNAYANPRWEEDYAANRLGDVDYRPKVSNVRRHWLYLRARAGDADEYFVTFDRVSSTDADFAKSNLLHFIGEPEFLGGNLVTAEVPGHIETWNANRFQMELGGAVLHGEAVLPANARIRKVGGEGYEYWVNGVNYDPFPDDANPLGGVWRLEIMPPTAAEDDLFLNVLHPAAIGGAAPTVTRIPGSSCEGASFDGWVVMFAKTETPQTAFSYSVAMSGSQRHVLGDMAPGYTYQVYRNGDATPLAQVVAGSEGIMEFTSPGGGSFQVSQGDYVPDETPPTGSFQIQGEGCSGESTVQLALSASDGESGMGWMRFRIGGGSWSQDYAYQSSWQLALPAADGPVTVAVLFGDLAGNWMSQPVSDSVTLDLTPPAGSFAIAEDTVAGSLVTLNCAATDAGCAGDAISMSFSNNGTAWSAPEPLAPTRSWDLGAQGEGTYTVRARYSDGAGNWSDPPLSDTVVVDLPSDDTVAPEFTMLSPANGATGVSPTTYFGCIVRDLGSGVDTTSVVARLDGAVVARSVTPMSGSRYQVVAYPPSGLAESTTYPVSIAAVDLAETPNAGTASWSFTTGTTSEDAEPPAAPTGLTAVLDEDCAVVLDWDASSDPNVVAYRVSYGQWPDGPATALAYQTEIGALIPNLPDGDYWLGVLARNNMGQESALALLPAAFTVLCDEDDPDQPDLEPTLEYGQLYPPGVMVDDRDAALKTKLRRGWTVRIFTVSGRLVYGYRAELESEDFTWSLLNREGSRVSKGLYLVRVFDAAGSAVSEGKYLRR